MINTYTEEQLNIIKQMGMTIDEFENKYIFKTWDCEPEPLTTEEIDIVCNFAKINPSMFGNYVKQDYGYTAIYNGVTKMQEAYNVGCNFLLSCVIGPNTEVYKNYPLLNIIPEKHMWYIVSHFIQENLEYHLNCNDNTINDFILFIVNLYKLDYSIFMSFINNDHYIEFDNLVIIKEFNKNPTKENINTLLSSSVISDEQTVNNIFNFYNIKNFLTNLIDSKLFSSNIDINDILTNLLHINSKYAWIPKDGSNTRKDGYNIKQDNSSVNIQSKNNEIKITLEGNDEIPNTVLMTIIITQDDIIQTKTLLYNDNDFFNQIQWLHDVLVDMNYNEQYIRLLERE